MHIILSHRGTFRRGKVAKSASRRRFARPERRTASRPSPSACLCWSSAYQQERRACRLVSCCRHMAAERKHAKRPAGSRPGRSGNVSHLFWQPSPPRWAPKHYQVVIFASNVARPGVAFPPRLLLICNAQSVNCACPIFRLALQQGSGGIPPALRHAFPM
jgi:hypothetical protein